jgi:CBS domain-containing protein
MYRHADGMPGLITLYGIAFVLEALGTGLVVLDLSDARRRLQSYNSSPSVVDLRAAQGTALPLTTIVVVDDAGRPAGVVTGRDIVSFVAQLKPEMPSPQT